MIPIISLFVVFSTLTILLKLLINTFTDMYYPLFGIISSSTFFDIVFILSITIINIVMFLPHVSIIQHKSLFYLYVFLPLLFIVAPVVITVLFFPKLNIIGPFSNTFGYLFISLLPQKIDERNIFDILTNNDETCRQDKSYLINELTVDEQQFDGMIRTLFPKILQPPSEINAALTKLKQLVRFKTIIGEYIWYVLALIIAISVTSFHITGLESAEGVDYEETEDES